MSWKSWNCSFLDKNLTFFKIYYFLFLIFFYLSTFFVYQIEEYCIYKFYCSINFVWSLYFFRFLAIYHKNGLRKFLNNFFLFLFIHSLYQIEEYCIYKDLLYYKFCVKLFFFRFLAFYHKKDLEIFQMKINIFF